PEHLLDRPKTRGHVVVSLGCPGSRLFLPPTAMSTGPNGTTAQVSSQEASMQAEIHSEAFLHRLMRDQLKLSISCAVAFLVALLGLPLLNYFYPEQMNKDVGGFTVTWLLLGVLFFPLVWVIA